MIHAARSARVNMKALIILATLVSIIGAGVVVIHYVRKRSIAARALAEGRAAFEGSEWQTAARCLRQYLEKYPDDTTVLPQYALSQLRVRPLAPENVAAAIGAYRRLMRLRPHEESSYAQLAVLYAGTGSFGELAYIARKRLEVSPDDLRAPLWLARGLLGQRKPKEALEVLEPFVERLKGLPDKHPEFVEACLILSQGLLQSDSEAERAAAMQWIDRAVNYDPNSAEARVNRARFLRTRQYGSDQAREKALSAARADLDHADALRPTDPRIRLALCEEWMELDDFARATAELEAFKAVDQATVAKHFLDPEDWIVSQYLRSAELALRKGDVKEAARLSDDVLSVLKHKRQRVAVLPLAVRAYASANRAPDARRSLDEYLEARTVKLAMQDSDEKVAILQATVASVEGKSYRVIELLEPIVVRGQSRPIVWRMLAEAYSRTDQPRRSIGAMRQYLRLQPRDQQIIAQLSRECIRQRDWRGALEATRLAGAAASEDLTIRLLRAEVGAYAAVDRVKALATGPSTGRAASTTATQPGLEALARELAALRVAHPTRADVRVLQAVVAVTMGRPDEAESELKLAIRQCDSPLLAELQLAQFYANAGRTNEAIEVCREACRRHAKSTSPWTLLAEIQQGARQYDDARQTLNAGAAAVEAPWEKRELRRRLAMLEAFNGDRKAGIDVLKVLVGEDSQDVASRSLLLGFPEVRRDEAMAQKLIDEIRTVQGQSGLTWRLQQASLWMGSEGWRSRQKEITELLDRCVDGDPAWPAPVLLLGNLYERLGNFDRAEATYRRALSVNPAATEVADRLLTLLESQRRFPEAKQVLDQVDASEASLSARRIRTAIGSGDFAQAIEELRARAEGNPKDVSARVLLARLQYRQTRDLGPALKLLDEAAALAPGSVVVAAARVSILRTAGKNEEARQVLDEQVKRNNSFDSHLLRAAYLAAMGQVDLAEQAYVQLSSMGAQGEGFEWLGRFYQDVNRPDDAIASWERGLKAFPNNLSIKRRLTSALFSSGRPADHQRGLEMLASLEKQLPNDPELLWIRALLLLKSGTRESTRQAQQILERVVELRPTAIDAHLGLISIAAQRGDLPAARDLAVRALGANPNSPLLLLARADAERRLGNYTMARELARLVLTEDPNSIDAREILVDVALNGRAPDALEEALDAIGEALKRQPQLDRLHVAKSRLLGALDRSDQALSELLAYTQTEQGGKSVSALLAVAEAYRVRGEQTKVGEFIDKAAQIAPDTTAILMARIAWLGNQKKYDQLVEMMKAYRDKHHEDPTAMIAAASFIGSSESETHRKEAIALLERVMAIAPDSAEAQHNLALLSYQTGNADRAKQIWQDLLKADPCDVKSLNDLAWVLAEHDRQFEDALKLADRGVELAPQNVHLRDTRGMILSNIPNRLKDARRDFEKAVDLTPPDSVARARALLQLGRVCASLKDTGQVARCLGEALRIDQSRKAFSAKEKAEIDRLMKGS